MNPRSPDNNLRPNTQYSKRDLIKKIIKKLKEQVNMVLNAHRNRLNRNGEEAGGGGGERMEMGEGGLYIYLYTVTVRMTPALRCSAMRALFFSPHFILLNLKPPQFPTPTSSPPPPHQQPPSPPPLPHPQ